VNCSFPSRAFLPLLLVFRRQLWSSSPDFFHDPWPPWADSAVRRPFNLFVRFLIRFPPYFGFFPFFFFSQRISKGALKGRLSVHPGFLNSNPVHNPFPVCRHGLQFTFYILLPFMGIEVLVCPKPTQGAELARPGFSQA